MKKFFTFVLPDEPYKTTTEKNITVNATYEGLRYLLCRVHTDTNIVEGVAFGAESVEDIPMDRFSKEEGYRFVVLDAAVNPFEAAYLSGDYSHDLIEDPEFELPNGLGTWVYHYDDYTGGISQAFYQHDMRHVNNKFIAPRYREHAITRESLMETSKNQAKAIKKSLSENDFHEEDRIKLEEYATWLENLDKTYKGVDHWKITFPANVPKY